MCQLEIEKYFLNVCRLGLQIVDANGFLFGMNSHNLQQSEKLVVWQFVQVGCSTCSASSAGNWPFHNFRLLFMVQQIRDKHVPWHSGDPKRERLWSLLTSWDVYPRPPISHTPLQLSNLLRGPQNKVPTFQFFCMSWRGSFESSRIVPIAQSVQPLRFWQGNPDRVCLRTLYPRAGEKNPNFEDFPNKNPGF